MSDFFWFSDAQWARIGPLLPTDTRGMARVDDRRVLSGIVHALRNGGRWADWSYVRKLVTELSGGVFGYLDSVLERHSFDEFGELI